MNQMEKLRSMKKRFPGVTTSGLPEKKLEILLKAFPELVTVVDQAFEVQKEMAEKIEHLGLAALPELEMIQELQKDYVNFYEPSTTNPYIACAALGPWIVTLHGAVIHDNGGYGMLGFGHAPPQVNHSMARSHVMANVMTANIAQKEFADRFFEEVGCRRPADKRKPYSKIICMNSGSESVTVATRISDLNASRQTAPGMRHEGKEIKLLGHKGGFHGRTDRPAQASDSTAKAYQKLASFRDKHVLMTVEPNNIKALKEIFAKADEDSIFFECFFIEPVMGEGNPGVSITPEYYQVARDLTRQHGTMLLVDSIQAGLRAHGCLSIMDYPGFEELDPPDMETYSKALNAGQYPLSVLALTEPAAALYRTGIYGNTMTTNPRALEVACAVLESVTEEVRANIVARGLEFLERFAQLAEEFPQAVTGYQGTGLLCALDLHPEGYKVVGFHGLETEMRRRGIGVIHGGKNALRFTSHFKISSQEIDLVIDTIRDCLREGPIYKK